MGYLPLIGKSCLMVLGRYSGHAHAHGTYQAQGGGPSSARRHSNLCMHGVGQVSQAKRRRLPRTWLLVFDSFLRRSSHCTCIISAYNVGRHTPREDSKTYQQQLRYIQNYGLDSMPLCLFTVDFIAQLQVWQCQGDRLLVFMDMNKHIIAGCVACRLLAIGLREATHSHWGEMEPHTYACGLEPINAVWYSQDLEVILTLQLSLHEGVGDHRSVLVDITAQSAIGKQEFKVVHPHGKRLSSQNNGARTRYISNTWKHRCAPTGWSSILAPVSREYSPILLQQMLLRTCKLWTRKWQRCKMEANVSVK